MIAHVVMLNLQDQTDLSELASVMAGLEALQTRFDGFERLTHGANIDLESKSPDHPYGFVAEFRDKAALARYASDPAHHALGARLVALSTGGADGIIVFDIETPQGGKDA